MPEENSGEADGSAVVEEGLGDAGAGDAGARDAASADTGSGSQDAGGSSQDAGASSDAAVSADTGVEPPSDGGPAVRWLGRVEKTAQGARFTWPGTGFTTRIRGTGVRARIRIAEDADYFQLVVDDKASVLKLQAGEQTYTLAQNLAAGEHTITLWRRTETFNGTVEVINIEVQGELLAPSVPSKRLEVIGDSITVGFGVDCDQDDSFSYANENNYLTYEAITARALGADLFTLAQTSIGMYRDDDGQTDNQMPVLYQRTLGNSAASRWNFASWTPGAVVINLGTNDFAAEDPGQGYLNAYAKFVDDMRGRYPSARIYLAISPMLFDEARSQQRRYLEQVRSGRASKGDTNVALLELPTPTDAQWGCGHPNAAAHQAMATLLQQTLKRDLGW
ncbi:MAG TPA: SGNH/GDSL hydrolase family protein [Polyangiales bacterium]